jgi:aldehyde:ferredoxin oxidoreductase
MPCNSCLISCRIKWKIRDGEFAGESGMGSPYGKSATGGQLLGVEDHRKMIHWVTLANRAGIDFYTTTRIIDFVTTLYQRGEITKENTGGLELKRDYKTYLDLFNKMVNREGFGDILANGWMRLYQEFGADPQDYWYGGICKGVDFIYDARASNFHPLMMTFFTRPRPHHGGSHTLTNSPGKSLEEIRNQVERWGIPKDAVERIFIPTPHSGKFNVGRYTKYMEDVMRVKNALGACSIYTFFGLLFGDDLARLYSAATGLEITGGDLMKCGERIFNLSKLLNIREGFTREDDRVPELWFRPMGSPEGRIEMMDYFETKVMTKEDVEKILDDYYGERGWDVKKGIPTKQKLKELGLDDIARVLHLAEN